MSSAIPECDTTVKLSSDCYENICKILSYCNSNRRFADDLSLKEMTGVTVIETLVERQVAIIDLLSEENLCLCPLCTSAASDPEPSLEDK